MHCNSEKSKDFEHYKMQTQECFTVLKDFLNQQEIYSMLIAETCRGNACDSSGSTASW